ncbi:MarC family protein [Comamonas thiooxydans]|uniref:MarC family protein n=1 Tax=Comamonas thiooxydans TaxID=363952 RepID=UPI000B422E0B|nr:MarC family protein [Comamonas thiooxydans]
MEFGFLLKKLLTLTALVDPFLAAPLFLAATKDLAKDAQVKFARLLGLTVATGLLGGGLIGLHVLQLMGVSLGAMQLAGGLIALLVALAMVIAKERDVKLTPTEQSNVHEAPSIVPLGIPLLVGPAALSYVMATSQFKTPVDLFHIIVPPVVVGLLTWGVLEFAVKTRKFFTPNGLAVLERLAGFLLAAIAVEMMGAGIRAMFPTLLD